MNNFTVFKKNSIKMVEEPVVNGEKVKGFSLGVIGEEGNKNNFGCGLGNMKKNGKISFEVLYNEVSIILKGIFEVKIGDEIFFLTEGDVLFMKKGVFATFLAKTDVETFFVNYPI